MPDHEQDVQTSLTAAIPLTAAFFGNMLGRKIKHAAKTPPSSEQPTEKPRGIGLDVLTLLDARRVLALEAKKVDHEKGRLAKVEDVQIKFLQQLEKQAMVDSYFVFDRVPDFRFLHLDDNFAPALATLGAIAAVPPDSIEVAIEETKKFIGQKASGLTMLDVVTRIIFEPPEVDPNIVGLMSVIAEIISNLNNCVLWFFTDGYVEELTIDQVRKAFLDCTTVGGKKGKDLLRTHAILRSIRTKRQRDVKAEQQANSDYEAAKIAYLAAVHAAAVDGDHGGPHEAEMEVGSGSQSRPKLK